MPQAQVAQQDRAGGATAEAAFGDTKQAMPIAMLQAPEGATMEEITAANGWQAHAARRAMSGAFCIKRGLVVVSAKEGGKGAVYRIGSLSLPSDNDPV